MQYWLLIILLLGTVPIVVIEDNQQPGIIIIPDVPGSDLQFGVAFESIQEVTPRNGIQNIKNIKEKRKEKREWEFD